MDDLEALSLNIDGRGGINIGDQETDGLIPDDQETDRLIPDDQETDGIIPDDQETDGLIHIADNPEPLSLNADNLQISSQHKGFLEKLNDKLFIPKLIFSALFYIVDVFSDLYLAIRYFREKNPGWGGCTLGFFLAPWSICTVLEISLLYKNATAENAIFLICALFNVLPVKFQFSAVRLRWTGDTERSKRHKKLGSIFGTVHILFEALPEAGLQLYIASQSNQLDAPLIVGITTSLCSLTAGMLAGPFALLGLRNDVLSSHEILRTLLFLPWILFHIIGFLPAVAFLSSLKNHT